MMKDPIHCHLIIRSLSIHLQQILSGIEMLRRQGLVTVSYEKHPDFGPKYKARPVLWAIVNGVKVVYEMFDGKGLSEDIDLDDIDFYFKRSFDHATLQSHPHHTKFLPYGLNYAAFEPGSLNEKVSLAPDKRSKLYAFLQRYRLFAHLMNIQHSRHVSSPHHLAFPPAVKDDPKVLFSVRLWDPSNQTSEAVIESYHAINQTRIECVKQLMRELGSQFVGGIIPNPYATQMGLDGLYARDLSTIRRKYIQQVKQSDVCIATTGLHGSIGWKLAEYVATSRPERSYLSH